MKIKRIFHNQIGLHILFYFILFYIGKKIYEFVHKKKHDTVENVSDGITH